MVRKTCPKRPAAVSVLTNAACMLALILGFSMPAGAYAAAGVEPVKTQITVACEGKNTNETFVYDLEAESEEHQEISVRTLELKNGEKGQIDITYDLPGAYHYTVSQREGTDPSTTYDKTVYSIDVYVTEDDNGIMYTDTVAYIDGEKEKKTEVVFRNVKKTTPGGKKKSVKTSDSPAVFVWPSVTAASLFAAVFLLLSASAQRRRDKEN